jgi:hypothetical protein
MAEELETKKLSELPLASSIKGTDVFVGEQDLIAKRFPASLLLLRGNLQISDFGAVGDGVTDDLAAFNAAAAYAESLSNGGVHRGPPVELGTRSYALSAATSAATWWLPPGADIVGLPGVAPAYQTDTTRLTGTIFRFSGVDQYGTIYVGDTAYTNQKKTGRLLAAQLMGASNRAAGGVSGFTYTSARNGADQASIGTAGQAYNDNTATPKTAWGFYGEGIRALAGTGNTFGAELSSFNYAPVISSNPYQQPGETTGVTVGLWLSALGDVDSTAALGVITAGRKWQKGLVFYSNSLATDEAVVMPYGYRMGWHLSGSSGMASYVKSDILQQYSVDGPCYTRGTRGGATTVNNTLVKLDSWSGNNAGTEVVLASARLYQTAAFSGGFATSRMDWSAKTAAGADNFMSLDQAALFPLTTSGLSLGKAGNLWSQVFAATSTISTSDERFKTDIKVIPDKVLDAWQAVEFQMFRMKDAKASKGKDARWHFGVIAQRVKAAFEEAGLDPFAYGLLCYDEWEAQEGAKDEETGQVVPAVKAGERYGIRYEEALVLESALMRRTQKLLTARLEKLEAAE